MGLSGWDRLSKGVALVVVLGAGLALAGCSTTDDSTQAMAMLPPPDQAMPVQNSTVASNNLPPIGADGSVQVANTDNGWSTDQQQTGAIAGAQAGTEGMGQPNAMPPATGAGAENVQTANAGQMATPGVNTGGDSSFVSLNDINPNTSGTGRDLSGGLTVEKLLGGWTVTSGEASCRLNLTYSQKAGTDRYRASSPNCAIPALASVASWQLVGGQIQLFNDGGHQIANLLQSGGRFIGALSGGQGISMAG